MELTGKETNDMSPGMARAWELVGEAERKQCIQAIARSPNYAKGWVKKIKNLTAMDVDEKELLKLFGKG